MEILSAENFRRQLVGLEDPSSKLPEMELTVIKEEAVKLISILPELFSSDFDRKTMWDRIGNGLVVCTQKSSGNYEEFINNILDYIKADPGRVAANTNLENWISSMEVKPKEWHEVFLSMVEKKHFLITVKGRAVWNMKKKMGDV